MYISNAIHIRYGKFYWTLNNEGLSWSFDRQKVDRFLSWLRPEDFTVIEPSALLKSLYRDL